MPLFEPNRPDTSSPTTEELAQSIVTLSNILDHALSQIDSLRGQINTLTRRLEERRLVLGDGKTVYIQIKE